MKSKKGENDKISRQLKELFPWWTDKEIKLYKKVIKRIKDEEAE